MNGGRQDTTRLQYQDVDQKWAFVSAFSKDNASSRKKMEPAQTLTTIFPRRAEDAANDYYLSISLSVFLSVVVGQSFTTEG